MKTLDQYLQKYAEAYRRNEAKVVSDLERKLASYEKVVEAARIYIKWHVSGCCCDICNAVNELDKGEHQ